MKDRSLLDYWLILYERRFAIYLVVGTSIVSAILIGWAVTPIYEARAALYIPAKVAPVSYMTGDSPATVARQQNAPIEKETEYKPYLGMLKSAQLAHMVHARYPRKSVARLLRSDVDFEITDELIVRVYSRDPDPKLAADVANAYVEGLNKLLSDGSQAQVDREPTYITSALSRVNADLKKAESELQRFEEKHHLVSLDTELTALSAQKTDLQDRAEETLVAIAANRGKQAAVIAEVKREGHDLEASEVALFTLQIQHLRTQLADTLTRIAELEAELGKNNVTVIAMYKRRDDLERQLKGEANKWLSARVKPETSHLEVLRQRVIDEVVEGQRLDATSKANARAIARLSERLLAYPEIKARGATLKTDVDRYRRMQEQLQVTLNEAQLQSERQMQLLVQLDRAEPPGAPAFPIWWLNLLVALFAGIVAGVGYAFFLNYVAETRNVRTIRLVQAILRRNEAAAA